MFKQIPVMCIGCVSTVRVDGQTEWGQHWSLGEVISKAKRNSKAAAEDITHAPNSPTVLDPPIPRLAHPPAFPPFYSESHGDYLHSQTRSRGEWPCMPAAGG